MKLNFFLFFFIILFAAFLRFYHIELDPPGLYIDEVSGGYNAYTILKTGKDEHGVVYPIAFKAFGEYKMPVYIYLTTLSMSFFGKNEFAVRFPSAFSGILTIVIVFFFIRILIDLDKSSFTKKHKDVISMLCIFLLAISSWHIQFSRGGFDATVSLAFFMTALLFFLRFLKNKTLVTVLISFLFFGLTLYTYNSYRVITPIVICFLLGVFYKDLKQEKKKIFLSILFFAILIFPMVFFWFTPEGSTRFNQTSAFSEYSAVTLFNKLSLYPMVFIKNYISYFSFNFLFNGGDGIGRHQIPSFGLLFRWEWPFLLAGLYYLFSSKASITKKIILLLLFISPIPGALTRPSPHSLRDLSSVVPLTILIGFGIFFLIERCKQYKLYLVGFVSLIACFEFLFYVHFYYFHYSMTNIIDWGGGYKETIQKMTKYKQKYTKIYVDNNLAFMDIYVKFYDPSLQLIYVAPAWQEQKFSKNEKNLYVRPYYGKVGDPRIIDTVYLPNLNRDIYTQFWKL